MRSSSTINARIIAASSPLASSPVPVSVPDRLRRVARQFALWTMIGLFFGTQAIIYAAYSPNQRWQPPMLSALADWYIWGLFAPLILALGRRFPLTRGHVSRSIPILAVASLLVTGLKIITRAAAGQIISGLPTMPLRGMLLSQLHLNLATFWVILGIGAAFRYYREFRQRELIASQLEARLAEARLEVLRTQLQPHFLFNTLHTISAFVQEGDVATADRMIARLSELLRLSIDGGQAQEVPLRQEMEFLQRYLDLQQLRFQERLRVRLDIADETLDARIPSLVLQPLVENAIRHGIGPRLDGGTITVRARRAGNELRVDVEDDGVGLAQPTDRAGTGVGLANTRARLAHLYGERQRFSVESPTGGGVRIAIAIPFSEVPNLAVQAASGDG
jgi:two-component sensor histidine kinase